MAPGEVQARAETENEKSERKHNHYARFRDGGMTQAMEEGYLAKYTQK